MINVFDYIKDHPEKFQQFKVDDLLFVEYHCIVEETRAGAWTHNNYFSYTTKGKKGLKSFDKEYIVNAGDALFIKKGAYTAHQFFEDDYCALFIFVPDEFIKRVIQEHQIKCVDSDIPKCNDTVLWVEVDEILSTYFQSVLNYFTQSKPPPKQLLKVKFEELIINILTGVNNRALAGYFNEVCANSKIAIRDIMEANFIYNMKLEEFAKLSGRSLSTFRRDFEKTYGISPGEWLTQKRLDYSKYLLETTDKSINEVTFESGFENPSHFSRIFKEKFNTSPRRLQQT